MRCGTVAIIGRTNVGKSTFLNAALGERIAIVSPLPQTTRDDLLGVVHRPGAQIAFTDTPGFHRPKTELGRRMNQTALDSARSHDVVVFMTDVSRALRPRPARVEDPDPISEDDRRLLSVLRPGAPAILVLNKVDLLRDKTRLLPLITAFDHAHPFDAIVPTSMLSSDGVDRVLAEIEARLPEGDARFAEDVLTDKPATFFVREYVREQVMQLTRREVPHAVAVTVERYEESQKLLRIQATIHVEKAGQRAILVGQRGQGIKTIGIGARTRLEALLGKQIHLELFVRITERWKDMPRQLQEMGYDGAGGRDLSSVLPARPARTSPRKPKAAKAGSVRRARPAVPRGQAPKPGARPATSPALGVNTGSGTQRDTGGKRTARAGASGKGRPPRPPAAPQRPASKRPTKKQSTKKRPAKQFAGKKRPAKRGRS